MGGLIRSMLVAAAIGAALVAGCGSGEETTSTATATTEERLQSAYAALADAAEMSPEEFAAYQRRVIRKARRDIEGQPSNGPVVESGKLTTTNYLALANLLHDRGVDVGTTFADPNDLRALGRIVEGVRFAKDPESIVLVTPQRLGHSPPAELIAANVKFLALAPGGRIVCLVAAPGGAAPCERPPPGVPAFAFS